MPDVTALPQPGDSFAGKYLIERVIGSGKSSLVYAARHQITGRRFAIEWLLPSEELGEHDAVIQDEDAGDDADDEDVSDAEQLLSDESDPFDRPSSEHRVVGHFRHPNVLEVYDVGEQSGSLYTVMDWSDGESLEARLARTGPMAISDARRLLIPCMRGMHEAHKAGILHRDLKPANIFICKATETSPEVVKILDFEVGDATTDTDGASLLFLRASDVRRAPYYRAPEQLGGLSVDHRADVYAFGAILYEILSGRPPFAPTCVTRPVSEIPASRALSLPLGGRSLPPGAGAIIARAMARNVVQRFQSLGEFADVLETYSARVESSSIPPPRSRHFLAEIARTQPMAAVAPPTTTRTPLPTESVRDAPTPQPAPVAQAALALPVARSVYVALAVIVVLVLALGVRAWMRGDRDVVATYDAATTPDVAVELAPSRAEPERVAVSAPPAPSLAPNELALPSGRAEPAIPPPAAPVVPEPAPGSVKLDPQLAAASSALEATLKMLQSQDPETGTDPALGAPPPLEAAATDSREVQPIRLPLRAAAAKPIPSPAPVPKLTAAEKSPSNVARSESPRARAPQPAVSPLGESQREHAEPHSPKPRREPAVERDPLDMNLM